MYLSQLILEILNLSLLFGVSLKRRIRISGSEGSNMFGSLTLSSFKMIFSKIVQSLIQALELLVAD